MSHHSSDQPPSKLLSELMRQSFGEYPDGRLNEKDEGSIPLAIGVENGRVTMQFARNLNWIGFTPEQAIDIAEMLIKHARNCGCNKPVTLTIP